MVDRKLTISELSTITELSQTTVRTFCDGFKLFKYMEKYQRRAFFKINHNSIADLCQLLKQHNKYKPIILRRLNEILIKKT